jgi:chromosome segregation ATPase
MPQTHASLSKANVELQSLQRRLEAAQQVARGAEAALRREPDSEDAPSRAQLQGAVNELRRQLESCKENLGARHQALSAAQHEVGALSEELARCQVKLQQQQQQAQPTQEQASHAATITQVTAVGAATQQFHALLAQLDAAEARAAGSHAEALRHKSSSRPSQPPAHSGALPQPGGSTGGIAVVPAVSAAAQVAAQGGEACASFRHRCHVAEAELQDVRAALHAAQHEAEELRAERSRLGEQLRLAQGAVADAETRLQDAEAAANAMQVGRCLSGYIESPQKKEAVGFFDASG